MEGSVISLRNLEIAFGAKKVLQGVNLEVKKGETLAVIGPSGTGKSTILKVLTGLLEPSGGSVFIEGQDVSHLTEEEWNEIRKHVGMVFQYSALFDFLDVGENVAFGLRQHFKLPEEEVRKKVDDLLQDVGMPDAKSLYPVELSGGMKKRVSLARALAFGPRIVLYDEPTAGLDPIRTMNISRLIRETQKKHKVTSILVTHDMESVYVAADRVALLNDGKIAAIGTPEEFKTSEDPLIRGFITGEEIKGATEAFR
ncbi:MAG: ABC transporter ATP-binding protein [Acidaminococcaceae bacterium]|nr:ABC transporter ATP-binding protein [Acidaminococcaceae bacterium]MBR1590877.1 ABC transporter ATP-binding protein [Acidaminococcaceae bacterium]